MSIKPLNRNLQQPAVSRCHGQGERRIAVQIRQRIAAIARSCVQVHAEPLMLAAVNLAGATNEASINSLLGQADQAPLRALP
jgi:hypothetical protein